MGHYRGKVLHQRYRLTHKIGQGGMAVVYLAEDLGGFNQRVAIKQNGFSTSQADRQLFEDEARLLVELSRSPNCPRNLPTFLEYFVESEGGVDAQYIVMTYIEGEDLESMVTRAGALDDKVVLFWIDQVLQALEFAHSRPKPIIHRDIKPSNIRISAQSEVAFLVDFGIAGASSQRLVTEGFSPPEQYRGLIHTTVRSDVYALGATLYVLLTGQAIPSAIERAAGKSVPTSTKLDRLPVVKTVVEQAMMLDPAKRYANITTLRQALQAEISAQKPTLPKNMRLQIQAPIVLGSPPPMAPRITGRWLAELNGRAVRLVMTPSGILISGGDANELRLWSIAVPTWTCQGQVDRVPAHQDAIMSLTLSRDGLQMASGSRDRTIKIWDSHSGQQLNVLANAHQGTILATAFSPDQQVLASSGTDNVIRLWNPAQSGGPGHVLARNVRAHGLAFNPPDGRWLAAACQDNKVRVWNMQNRTEETLAADVRDHDGWVADIAFSPDGALLAAGGADGLIHLVEIRDRKTGVLGAPKDWKRRYVPGKHGGTIYCLAFSPDSRLLATGGDDRMVQIWDVIQSQNVKCLGPFPDKILSVAFGPHWQSLAVAMQNGEVWLVRLI